MANDSSLKDMTEPKLIYTNKYPKNEVRIYFFNGMKFRFHFPHLNGSSNIPTLSKADGNGIWRQIETSETLHATWKNLYHLSDRGDNPDAIKRQKDENDSVECAFLYYIKSVYTNYNTHKIPTVTF